MKVLYVEDNPANVFLVKRVAKMGQHEIVNYIDGDQAIQKFEDINPDLVLMDIQLAGGMSGLDVVKKLREKGFETPIIAVTAYAMVGDKERCIEAGCTDYLAKPLPIPRLVELFKHYSDEAEAKASSDIVSTPADETQKAELETAKTNADTASSTEANVPETVVDEKASDPTVESEASQESTPETELTTDVSSNSNTDDTMDEKSVTPINISNKVEDKEEVSTGGA